MIIRMIFNMSTSYFHKFSFHYLEDYLLTKLTLGQGTLLVSLPPSSLHPTEKNTTYGFSIISFFFPHLCKGGLIILLLDTKIFGGACSHFPTLVKVSCLAAASSDRNGDAVSLLLLLLPHPPKKTGSLQYWPF